MRRFVVCCSALLVALMATAATADDGDKEKGKHPDRGPEFRQKMLEKFDTDKDGKLDEEERAKARKAMQERFGRGGPGKGGPGDTARRGPGPGGPGPGGPGQAGRRGRGPGPGGPPPGMDREKMRQKLDADKDGKLNEEERAKARKAMQERFGRGGPGGPRSGIDREKIRARMLKKFDADKDGKLTGEEREKARKAMQEHMGRGGPGKGKPGQGGPGKGQSAHKAWLGHGTKLQHGFHGPPHAVARAKHGPRPRGPAGKHGQRPPTEVKSILQMVTLIDINGDGKLDDHEVRITHAKIDQIAGRRAAGPRGGGPPPGMRPWKRDGGPPPWVRPGMHDGPHHGHSPPK